RDPLDTPLELVIQGRSTAARPGGKTAMGTSINPIRFQKTGPSNMDHQSADAPAQPSLLPVPVDAIPVARPIEERDNSPCSRGALVPAAGAIGSTDACAVVSAVCGLTAIVPVVSQVAGLGFGLASTVRLIRAHRAGRLLRGWGWVFTGLLSSGVALIGWIAVFVAFGVLSSSLADSSSTLQNLSHLRTAAARAEAP
ncbi:MAG: hypothetical protein JSV78_02695, partial [Phycisphaerales bacterium]